MGDNDLEMTRRRVPAYEVKEGEVAGRCGAIGIRDYVPSCARNAIPLLWVHGGGWFGGSIRMKESDAPAKYLASRGRVVRTVDYRLAPPPARRGAVRREIAGNRFPAGLHDVVDAALDLSARHGSFALGGASAGANLAAGATLMLQQEECAQPASLVLVYGVFHGTMPEQADVEKSLRGTLAGSRFMLAEVHRMTRNYVGDESLLEDPLAFPANASLSGLPPTLMVDATNDVLRRSSSTFADAATAAGSHIEYRLIRGRHGFLNKTRSSAFLEAVASVERFLDTRRPTDKSVVRGSF
jgi:acetyl esterase